MGCKDEGVRKSEFVAKTQLIISECHRLRLHTMGGLQKGLCRSRNSNNFISKSIMRTMKTEIGLRRLEFSCDFHIPINMVYGLD